MRDYNPEEMLRLSNGTYIVDPDDSKKMAYIKSVRPERAYQDDSTAYTWDEAGMADLFGECYKKDTRYCPEHKSWYTYDSGKWQKDTGALLVSRKIKEFTRLMALYCGEITDEEVRKNYMKFVSKMGDRRFRDRLMKDAADCLQISAVQFDSNPYLLNLKNGTYNLETGRLQEHDPDDFLTMQTNFSYTADKENPPECGRWLEFIEQVTEDAQKADYLQRALGYSLLGTSNEECMFILWGKTTRNGKSTLLDAVQHMLGDYSTVVPVELICRESKPRSADSASPILARLKGKRFVTMAESDTAGRLDEAVIKQYTGGEEITARELYQSPITFKPQFTMWLSCNDLPQVKDKSLFASDRLRVISFDKHFSEAEQDKTLKDFFETEGAMRGIFTWLLGGYDRYKQQGVGLQMPGAMREIVRGYEKDNDTVLQFLESQCKRDSGNEMKAKTLYDRYKTWSRSCGYGLFSFRRFNSELTMHTEWYDSINTGVVTGISLGGGSKT